jgi:BlaI family transcriptional regulator, penicillinase repressor
MTEKKGYVGHKAYGKTHEYFPLIAKDAYAERNLSELVDLYFDGSVQRLVSQLAQQQRLTKADLDELLKLLGYQRQYPKFNELF